LLADRIRGNALVAGASATSAESVSASHVGKYQYLVPMHSGTVGSGTPLFIVAGMFGNVLNLSHLAHLLGDDRPVIAIQARGLYGSQEPHESFEEMARDYLQEIRQVQPCGPYQFAGFSGGGFVAFEMARQIIAAGELVSSLVFLDTPIRADQHFSRFNKLEMSWPRIRKEGLRFFINKVKERREWRQELAVRELARQSEPNNAARFHSQRVGDAFLRSLATYRVQKVDVDATLFRPRLAVRHQLRDGRMIDAYRNVLLHDNGWSLYVRQLQVVEVPGNHDSMVLEPNVRVLAARIRRIP
jgi:thioesterase domain-containing protein